MLTFEILEKLKKYIDTKIINTLSDDNIEIDTICNSFICSPSNDIIDEPNDYADLNDITNDFDYCSSSDDEYDFETDDEYDDDDDFDYVNCNDSNSEFVDNPEDIKEEVCVYSKALNYTSNNLDVDFDNLSQYIETNKKLTFQQLLFMYIDELNLSDSDIYKMANLDRRLFSKIRCDKNYKPSKATVLSLSLALKLTKAKTKELLKSAGYTLSNSSKFDLIICFCIEQRIFNILQVNYALEQHDCVIL